MSTVELKGADAEFNGKGGFGQGTHPWSELLDGKVRFYSPGKNAKGELIKHFAYQARKKVEGMVGKNELPRGTEVKCTKFTHEGKEGFKIHCIKPAAAKPAK